jgi:hypothetical protein
MIKIKICTQNPGGPCSFYRSLGVLNKLQKISSEQIITETITNFDWNNLADCDIVFFERPRDEALLNAIKFTKDFGIKVWSDIDDDFFNVPKYNPNYAHFMQNKTKNYIEQCLLLSDVVSVTTNDLKEKYSKYNKNIHVIENAVNNYNFPINSQPSENTIINWRGSVTHRNDILSCFSSLIKLSQDNPNYIFNFIGNDLWYLEDKIHNIKIEAPTTQVQYFNNIKKIQPQIQITPLEFNTFNVAKSNISWLEGIYSGAVCVGPDMPEWNKPGIETYKTPDEFYNAVQMLIKDKKKRIKNFYNSLDYINENLLLSKINEKRIKLIQELLNK